LKKTAFNIVPIFDLNSAAYQHMNENTPELFLQGTRVSFLFKADETFFRLSAEYQSNIPVNVIDFVSAQRQLKSMMMALKGGKHS